MCVGGQSERGSLAEGEAKVSDVYLVTLKFLVKIFRVKSLQIFQSKTNWRPLPFGKQTKTQLLFFFTPRRKTLYATDLEN